MPTTLSRDEVSEAPPVVLAVFLVVCARVHTLAGELNTEQKEDLERAASLEPSKAFKRDDGTKASGHAMSHGDA